MAYFDDPNNRAAWEETMTQLREERERRLSGLPPEAVAPPAAPQRDITPERIPITFEEVLAQEQAARGVKSRAPAAEQAPISHERQIDGTEHAI